LLSCGGPIGSAGGEAVLVGAASFGALWASATVLAEASPDAITIRQSGCIIPQSFSDLAIPPRGAHGLPGVSIQAQLTLTGVDQHQFSVFLCLDRHGWLTANRDSIARSSFGAVH